MVLLEEVDDDGTPVLTRRKLGREDDGGADHSGEEDGEGGDGEEEGDEKKTRKKKGLAWGPLLMLIFMFGSSIGGAVLVALEYLGVTGGAKPGVDTTDTGYYWCVDQVSAFYRKRNPDKLSEVAALCTKYEGRERKLVKKLRRKYEGRY